MRPKGKKKQKGRDEEQQHAADPSEALTVTDKRPAADAQTQNGHRAEQL